jgi:hypothetical protein
VKARIRLKPNDPMRRALKLNTAERKMLEVLAPLSQEKRERVIRAVLALYGMDTL